MEDRRLLGPVDISYPDPITALEKATTSVRGLIQNSPYG